MRTAEFQIHCPKCEEHMGIADLSLGENFNLVLGCYCFVCKHTLNFAFTLGYLSNEMKKLYAEEAKKCGRPIKPPLKAIAAPLFTSDDKNFLMALRISDAA